MDSPILWVDEAYGVRWANSSAAAAYGDTDGPCYAVSHGMKEPCFVSGEPCPLVEAAARGETVSVNHVHGSRIGEPGIYRVTVVPMEGGGGLEFHTPLGDGLIRDPLLGLYRREFWREVVLREQALLQRADWPFSLLFVDVDHFKAFNDNYGHATGDEVLRRIGRVILGCCRQADVSGRYGGEELLVFLPNTRSREALGVAERIRSGVEALSISVPDGFETVTVSVGVATVESVTPLARAIKLSDAALLAAKAAGRNRVVLDPSSGGDDD